MLETIRSFTKKELKVIGALSTGTLLEYFDFFLYIHMAATLNKVFFDTTNEKSQFLLTSLAYLVPRVFRPIGAVILGLIGYRIGRVYTIYITLIIMAICSLGIFFLPSYAQIGFMASMLITTFRILQSVASMGEIVGAKLYLSEYLSGKKVALGLCFISLGCFWGGQLALHAIQMINFFGVNLRYLFLIGLAIFVVGFYSRANLRESIEFVQAKYKNTKPKKLNKKLLVALFGMESIQTSGWFFCYVWLNNILSTKFNYSSADLINHNIFIGFGYLSTIIFYTIVSDKVYPLYISKIKNFALLCMYAISPWFLTNITEAWHIVLYEIIFLTFISDPTFNSIVYRHLPTLKRSIVGTLSWSLPRCIVAFVISILPVYLEKYLGNYTYALVGGAFALYAFISVFILESIDKKSEDGFYKNYI